MASSLGFLIRDGLESDLDRCLELDHGSETDLVWQMTVFEEPGAQQISFKTEHLPRTMEVDYPTNRRRLAMALPEDHCFLVAISRDSDDSEELLGYLAMQCQPTHRNAQIQDLIVSRTYRGHGIGSRLLNVARKWAHERDLRRLTMEVQTKNYPGICFCQAVGMRFCGFNDRYFENGDIAVFFSQSLR